MRWDPEQVAGFAIVAGWDSVHLEDVVTLALAVTAGDDQWEWLDALPGGRHFQGLFAVDRSWWSETTPMDLLTPLPCARAARAAFVASGHGWGWAPIQPTDVAGWHRTAAAAAIATPDRRPALPSWPTTRATVGPTQSQVGTLSRILRNATIAAQSTIQRAIGG